MKKKRIKEIIKDEEQKESQRDVDDQIEISPPGLFLRDINDATQGRSKEVIWCKMIIGIFIVLFY